MRSEADERRRALPRNTWAWRLTGVLIAAGLALVTTEGRETTAGVSALAPPSPRPASSEEPRDEQAGRERESLRARHAALRRQLQQQAPTGRYIVVDTARNRLYVKQRETILLEALASTGSGTILDDPTRPGTRWIFDTPRGEYSIQSRLERPVWIKPDWAFLEEGLAIPSNPAERVEAGMLGEYALGFGKGYFIHGTLYKRLLGKNVTHGCIRLSDEDLRAVFTLAPVGTPVLIF